jgi:hypothetical protein
MEGLYALIADTFRDYHGLVTLGQVSYLPGEYFDAVVNLMDEFASPYLTESRA